jgi:biopolymer transport protein TolR
MIANRGRRRRRVMSEINVVPYIDVMLVLLVIFMITAPMFNQGVEVDLPEAAAEPLARTEVEPLVLTVDERGQYFLNVGEDPDAALTDRIMTARVAAVLRNRPQTPVLIKGHEGRPYGEVVRAMTLLQAAGAGKIGLMTRAPESPGDR